MSSAHGAEAKSDTPWMVRLLCTNCTVQCLTHLCRLDWLRTRLWAFGKSLFVVSRLWIV